ncbi:MAG: four helix bundle protein [Flavobacteriales bacterium]|nr:four helix bundle protein [Flavobacteriales bacterium]
MTDGFENTNNFKTYRDLLVWQKSMCLINNIYSICGEMPKNEEFILAAQIKRAAISIPSNLSEGWARKSNKAFSNHIKIAFGSTHEVLTQLEIVNNLYNINTEEITTNYIEISKMLNGLLKKLSH